MSKSAKATKENRSEASKETNIQVIVRCRPRSVQEKQLGSLTCINTNPVKKEVYVQERTATKTFTFDRVFGPDSTQPEVFKSAALPVINQMLAGYNCTIFAYGQTGTGKTYTMVGERSPKGSLSWEQDPMAGIIPRSMHYLFEVLNEQGLEYSMKVSFLELYNEELFDLLSPVDDTAKLRLFEDSAHKGSCIVQGLAEVTVYNKDDVYVVLERGQAKRQTASTLLNAHSSRSHSVFLVTAYIKERSMEVGHEELVKVGKLNLVDLAGSENIGRSGAVDKRAREAGSINQSLLTLGRVITGLVDHSPHVPYRESKLTRLLQDSLGGRTKTSIIATISPALVNMEESLSTLDYAHRAKNIMNRPEINQKLTKKELINEYTSEIERLKRDLLSTREKSGIFISRENYIGMETLIQSQKTNIEDLEERINLNLDQIKKLTSLFDETQVQLEQKSSQLDVEKGILEETKHRLTQTEAEKEKQEQLAELYRDNEERLYQDAQHLIHTVQDSERDISGLHAKLKRKREVEQKNYLTVESFRQNVSMQLASQSKMFSEYANLHTSHLNSLRRDIECWNQSSLQELQDTAIALNDVMLQMHEFSKQQNLEREDSCGEHLANLSSVGERVQAQSRSTREQLGGVVSFLNESLGRVLGRINSFQSEQEDKITMCSGKIDEICHHFKVLQAAQSEKIEQLIAQAEQDGARYEEVIEANKNTMLVHLTKQKDYEKDEMKTMCGKIEAELDEMKERLCEMVKSGCVKRGDILSGRGALLEENFEEQKLKHSELIRESVCGLRRVKESASSSVEKLTIGEDIKRMLGEEFKKLNAAYCEEVNGEMDTLRERVGGKIGAVGAGIDSDVSKTLQEISEKRTLAEENSGKQNEDFKSFLASNAVVAEDLDTRISDICEQYITETGERFLQEFEMMETNQQEVNASISELNADCISSLEKLEMSRDTPTGTTPVKRDLVYKRNLIRQRPQTLPLDLEPEEGELSGEHKRKCSSPSVLTSPNS